MQDINDMLGIANPPEQPNTKRKIIEDLLTNLVFSLGQGYSAQGSARGPAARAAGIGAAIQGPMVLQRIRQQQEKEKQDQAITLAKARELFRQGRNEDALNLVKAKFGMPTAMTSLPGAPTEPVVEGTPETGLTVKSLGEPTYAQNEPAQYELAGGQKIPIPIPNQQQVMAQQAAGLRQQEEIKQEFAPKSNYITVPGLGLFDLTTKKIVAQEPKNLDPNSPEALANRLAYEQKLPKTPTPFNVWQAQHPGEPVENYLKLIGSQSQGSVQTVTDPNDPSRVILARVQGNSATPINFQGQTATRTTAGQQNATAKEQQAYDESLKSLNAMKGLAANATYASDQAMADQFFNIIKPGAGARMSQQQIERFITPGPLKDRMQAWAQRLSQGQPLTAAARQDLINAAETVVNSKKPTSPATSPANKLSPMDQEIINASNKAKKRP